MACRSPFCFHCLRDDPTCLQQQAAREWYERHKETLAEIFEQWARELRAASQPPTAVEP